MEEELAAFRNESPKSDLGSRRRFTEEQRLRGVALAKRALALGMKPSAVYRGLGISDHTLRQWQKRKRSLVPVRVVTPVPAEPVRLFIGRMEAELSVEQLAELARRLW